MRRKGHGAGSVSQEESECFLPSQPRCQAGVPHPGDAQWEHNWERWGGSVGSPKTLTGAEPGPPDIGTEHWGHAQVLPLRVANSSQVKCCC